MSTTTIRLSADERSKLDRLARQAGVPPSTALRILVRDALVILPPRPATAVFDDTSAGSTRQDATRASVQPTPAP